MHETLFEIHRTQDQFITQIDQLTQRIVELQLAVINSNQQQNQLQQQCVQSNYQNVNDIINSGHSICDSPTTQLRNLCNVTSATSPTTTSVCCSGKSNILSSTTPQLWQQQNHYINHLSIPRTIACVATQQQQNSELATISDQQQREKNAFVVNATNQQQRLPFQIHLNELQEPQNFNFNDYNLTEQQRQLIKKIDKTTDETTTNDNEMDSSKIPLIKRLY